MCPDPAARDPGSLKILVVTSDKSFNWEGNNDWSKFLTSLGLEHEFVYAKDVGHSSRLTYEKLGPQVMLFHAANFAAAAKRK